MSVLLDTYAAIAVLKGEPAAKEVRPILEQGDAVIHPLNLGEVIDRMARSIDADPDDVEADIALLGVTAVDADDATLIDAGRWRARHYHRSDRPVSLADCVAGLCAMTMKIALATADQPCAEMVRDEGGVVYELPDSQGARPLSR
jgi:predicted nucleic acid-binding protein